MDEPQFDEAPAFFGGPLFVGEVLADRSLGTLQANDKTVRLEPIVMDLLAAFTETPGGVLSRDHLIDRVWSGRFGSDESLSRAVSILRKAIRDCGIHEAYIETVPKRGYRLLQPVKASEARQTPEASPVPPRPHDTSITVTPFMTSGCEAADEIGFEIVDGLSRFSWLRARLSADGRADSRFRLEGRQSRMEGAVQVSVRLIDQSDDAVIWSRSYRRQVPQSGDAAQVELEIAATIISSLGDPHGRLMATVFADFVRLDDDTPLLGTDAVIRTFLFKERVSQEDHRATRASLENARRLDPHSSDVWAASAYITIEEYKHEFNPLPRSRERALEMARQAITLDPRNAYARFCLAEVYFFSRDYGAFRSAGERAIELNPFDSDAMAMIGIMMFYGGDRERGVALTLRAMELNPDHPGWYRFAHIYDDILEDRLDRALQWSQRVQMPAYYADPYTRAIVLGLMGRHTEAQDAAAEMLALWGEDLSDFREKAVDRWAYRMPELTEKIASGLEGAGITLPGAPDKRASGAA